MAALAELFEKLKVSSSADERVAVAGELAAAVKSAGVSSLSTVAASLKEAVEDASNPAAREGGLVAFSKLVAEFGRKAEPFLVSMVATLLERAADKVAPVRTAAEDAAKALFAILNPYSTQDVLPALFDGMSQARNWQTKVLALNLLAGLAKTAPNQIAASLSDIVPYLTGECSTGVAHTSGGHDYSLSGACIAAHCHARLPVHHAASGPWATQRPSAVAFLMPVLVLTHMPCCCLLVFLSYRQHG